MPATSGSYNFQSIGAQFLIKEAFERIGILPDMIVAQQLTGALRSINLLLTDWNNRNFNFWVIEQAFIGLTPGVNIYNLPIQTLKVIQVELRTSQRNNFGGIAASSDTAGGTIAANAFDNNPLTFCTLAAVNGFISYQYPNANIITFVGINANNAAGNSWTIKFQGSNDNATWLDLLVPGTQVYPDNGIVWFDLTNIIPFTYYQTIQVANAAGVDDSTALSIRELYFNDNIIDITMSEVSQYNYLQYPQKRQLGRPVVYYVNYQITPQLYVWQTPIPPYNCLFYSAQAMVQMVVNTTDAIDIPSSFYEPLVCGLSSMLARKYAPDRAEAAEVVYQQALNMAIAKNRVCLPLTLGLYGTGS